MNVTYFESIWNVQAFNKEAKTPPQTEDKGKPYQTCCTSPLVVHVTHASLAVLWCVKLQVTFWVLEVCSLDVKCFYKSQGRDRRAVAILFLSQKLVSVRFSVPLPTRLLEAKDKERRWRMEQQATTYVTLTQTREIL